MAPPTETLIEVAVDAGDSKPVIDGEEYVCNGIITNDIA